MSDEPISTRQYLSFIVGEEELGLGILEVKEIVEYAPITRMPSVSAAIRGATNLRGQVVPVIDLSLVLGLGPMAITRWTCIVMVEVVLDGSPGVVGLLVERVSQVVDLAEADIKPPPSFGTRLRGELLRGMGQLGRKFLLILDVDRLLAHVAGGLALPSGPGGDPSAQSPAPAEQEPAAAPPEAGEAGERSAEAPAAGAGGEAPG